MKRYLEHIRSKEPHQRRQHAMSLAVLVTALVFIGWVATLPLRFGGLPVAEAPQSDLEAAVAGYNQAVGQNTLIVPEE